MDPIRVLLPEGQPATIRPMHCDDLAAIDAMHDRLGKQSLYYRYFVAHKPSREALRDQMRLSQCHGAALVVSLDCARNEVIGLAYYVCAPGDRGAAELAFLVEDRFQGQGLGGALFDTLVIEARSRGLHDLTLFILPENQRMFQILDRKGFPLERHYLDGMFEVRVHLIPKLVETKISIGE